MAELPVWDSGRQLSCKAGSAREGPLDSSSTLGLLFGVDAGLRVGGSASVHHDREAVSERQELVQGRQ